MGLLLFQPFGDVAVLGLVVDGLVVHLADLHLPVVVDDLVLERDPDFVEEVFVDRGDFLGLLELVDDLVDGEVFVGQFQGLGGPDPFDIVYLVAAHEDDEVDALLRRHAHERFVVLEHGFGLLVELGLEPADVVFRVEQELAGLQVELERNPFRAENADIRVFGDDEVALLGLVHLGQLRVGLVGRDELLDLLVNQVFDEVRDVRVGDV